MGSVSKLQVANEALKQQQYVIETDWKLQQRVRSVALPLQRPGLALCGNRVALRSGLNVASVHSYSKEWQPAARAAGLGDTLSVIGVTLARKSHERIVNSGSEWYKAFVKNDLHTTRSPLL